MLSALVGWGEARTPAVHGFLLEAWAGGDEPFWGVFLHMTQKQALRLGKMLPTSPEGMERMAACHAAGISPC